MRTITTLTAALFAMAMIASPATGADNESVGDDWAPLVTTHGNEYYFRHRDLERDQPLERRLVWVLAVQNGKKVYTSQYNINCVDQTIKDEYRSFFFDDGTVDGHAMSHLERRPATPGTMGGMLVDLACP